ncbi:MAG: DUF72 domain-containing protein [Deferribacteraceae bacterium]|jgi:uncharacterized protein YecE (DUF72 family)|nr:DUF72 domain-containing protein [Deferribacteraceae bacterium]
MSKLTLNETPLYIGTSGYNHDDWKGNFAPAEIHNYDLLTYYADKGFNFLEVAFTFYRMPEADKMKHILLRTGDRVKFSVRLPRTLIRNPESDADYNEFRKGIQPMIDSGTLACVYADYHPSFAAGKKNQEMILELKNRFTGIPFFAELMNRTWYKERVFDYFKENKIGMTILDMPQVRGFAPYYPICTNNNLYFKLYGRSPAWLTTEEKHLDYSYADADMKKFMEDAVKNSVMASNIFMVFANVANGKAPVNAMRLRELAK